MRRNRTEAERWLRQAQYDRQAAQANNEQGFHAWACFLCQQAAEKALKAFLYAQGEGPVIGHSTYRLVQDCTRYDVQFEALTTACKQLDQYYIPTRYPSGLPGGVPHEFFDANHAGEALRALDSVLALVETSLAAGEGDGTEAL